MSSKTPTARHHRAGPTDIHDPFVREEAKKALIWLGLAGLMVLAVTLAEPLMVVFGGMVFGALIDGGARLLGRVLPVPRIWRVALVLIAAVAGAYWFFTYAGSQIAEQAAAFPAMVEGQVTHALRWAARHGVVLDAKLARDMTEQALAGVSQLGGVVGGLIGGATTLFLIVVLGIYFAIDPAPYQRGLAWMLPRESRPFFDDAFRDMGFTLRRLLFGRIFAMVIEGLTIGIALQMYGVPMAALLGLVAGLLTFLPNIGAPISGALMVLVGFSGGVNMGLYCIGVYVVVQGVESNVIVPIVAKKTADLAPALVLAMQLIMGALFGILGLALADPLLAMLKVMLEHLAQRSHNRSAQSEAAASDDSAAQGV
ncbi:AI-2E family transporter [Novosphingobium sp. FSY-8]|uniref:AI-2E family transporter n=1 Tax=Novosphingobium ovatum TaxID=1908523 RepID=A0ABW9XD57_9SPHN|nr:AI-2E family transporter [Novosphingobium ovatum]NBC36466.1 AI-2E family transporter [Novosphingobium ovatum]